MAIDDTLFREWETAAYSLGEDAARTAASWTVDGNSDVAERARVLEMLRAGDPAADNYLPRMPDLSGEYADGATPASLLGDVVGEDADGFSDDDMSDVLDAISTAWENGRDETFTLACEGELIAFCGDPCPRCESRDTQHSGHGREGQEIRYCNGCDRHYQSFDMGDE